MTIKLTPYDLEHITERTRIYAGRYNRAKLRGDHVLADKCLDEFYAYETALFDAGLRFTVKFWTDENCNLLLDGISFENRKEN